MSDEVCPLGETPPLGEVPPLMHAAVIRRERYGQPREAFRQEILPTPRPGRSQVLVLVMAAGLNYNSVFAARGNPVDVIAARNACGQTEDFHIGGSEGAGIVWAVGEDVTRVAPGDEVVLAATLWDERAEDIRLGADPMTSDSALAMGYETNYGTFAQFTVVEDFQLHPKPGRLSWAEAAAFQLTAATVYRQLCGWPPHTVNPGDPVLIWGGSGGLGSMAIQITRLRGGIPIAVVSDPAKADHCLKLGAHGVINRQEFDHWGRVADLNDPAAFRAWQAGAKAFGRKFWEVLGERRPPRLVLEHPGQDTMSTSLYLCANDGMVVTCGATSGYHADIDLRYLWMRQKRLQGSHGANTRQYRAVTNLAAQGQLDPCLSRAVPFEEIGEAHQLMHDNLHPAGNGAVLVNAPATELR
ncbi:crotonyl-CoA carboxylase/reductase [Streptomyces sp. NPDC059850]|uniref:crotonyl-CoA carboxylase/reductase n=1 Tax=Streptomyces sp. NPDC059850 TaxID=3346970 RepID=UPI00365D7D21